MKKLKTLILLAMVFVICKPCWGQVKTNQASVIENLFFQANKHETGKVKGESGIESQTNAIKLYDQIIEIDKTNAEAYTLRADCKYNLGYKLSSIVDLTTAIKYTPDDDYHKLRRRYFSRAMNKSGASDHRGAILDYSKAIDIVNSVKYDLKDWQSVSLYLDLERTYEYRSREEALISDYDSAIADLNLILKRYPDSSFTPNYHYKKGTYLTFLGRKNAACIEFSKAAELGNVAAHQAIMKYCQ